VPLTQKNAPDEADLMDEAAVHEPAVTKPAADSFRTAEPAIPAPAYRQTAKQNNAAASRPKQLQDLSHRKFEIHQQIDEAPGQAIQSAAPMHLEGSLDTRIPADRIEAETVRISAQEWLNRIETMLQNGKVAQAREALAEFRKQYPEYPLQRESLQSLLP
jgi:hypothetical protein